MKHTARATGIEGRIVNLSSIAHNHTYNGGIRFDEINDQIGYVILISSILSSLVIHTSICDLDFKCKIFSQLHIQFLLNFSYSDKRAYGQSKLANILHANELSRRLQVN